MREAELRQSGGTQDNWKFFMLGALGFLLVVLLGVFVTQFVVKDGEGRYRNPAYPVGTEQAPLDQTRQSGAGQGLAPSADGAFMFTIPSERERRTIFYS